jgi:hypothetical protein
MKTKLLLLLATTLLTVGCAATDYSVGVNYYGRPAYTTPIPVGYNPHSAIVRPSYHVERPIIPAGFPCPELVPSYSVVRPNCGGRWGRSPGMIIID